MNSLIRRWRILRELAPGAIYNILKLRLKRMLSEPSHIVLKYESKQTSVKLIGGVGYSRFSQLSEMPNQDINQVHQLLGEKKAEQLLRMFQQGSVLWLIKKDGEVIGYWWSIRGERLQQWYIPLSEDDVVFYSAMIMHEWRGYSISPAVLIQIIRERMPEESAIYLDVETWNESAIKAWLKAGFIQIGRYPTLGSVNHQRAGTL